MPEQKKQVTLDLTKLSRPNMEFVVYVLALLVAMIVVWSSDLLNVTSWFQFFLFATIAYILSRGIAKAHNVKE